MCIRHLHLFLREKSAEAYILSRNGRSADFVEVSSDDVAEAVRRHAELPTIAISGLPMHYPLNWRMSSRLVASSLPAIRLHPRNDVPSIGAARLRAMRLVHLLGESMIG